MTESVRTPRVRRPRTVNLNELVSELARELGDARQEVLTLQSRLHIVRLKLGVTSTYVFSMRQALARRLGVVNGHR